MVKFQYILKVGERVFRRAKIMVVDSDESSLNQLYDCLSKEFFTVLCLKDGNKALIEAKKEDPDFFILEMDISSMDGIDLCQNIRKFSESPILFLSNNSNEFDKVLALRSGADDYMTKPFSQMELVARMKAHLRRSRMHGSPDGKSHLFYAGVFKMNLATQKVYIEDREIDLSVREFHILYQLAQHPGRIYSMEELYELVWGSPCMGDLRTVMVHISNLRKKLQTNADDLEIIETIRGAGYRFNENVLKQSSSRI